MVDSISTDEGCEGLDGEVNYAEWDKNDNKNDACSDET